MVKVTGEKADGGQQARVDLRRELEEFLAAPKFSHAPPAERTRRAGVAPKTVAVLPQHASSPRAHHFEAPLEGLMHKLPAEHFHAVARLRWAHEARHAHARIGDYGNSPGGSDPATRSGLSEIQQRAAARWEWCWPQLSPGTQKVLKRMVLVQPNGESPTIADAMAYAKGVTPTIQDKVAKPVWEVVLCHVAEIVAWVDRRYGRELDQRRRAGEEAKARRYGSDRR